VSQGMDRSQGLMFAAGFVSSAVVGYLAIRFFLRFVVHHSLRAFAYYRFGLAAVVATLLIAL
jgi:undecaprenyl-diphosphatase